MAFVIYDLYRPDIGFVNSKAEPKLDLGGDTSQVLLYEKPLRFCLLVRQSAGCCIVHASKSLLYDDIVSYGH